MSHVYKHFKLRYKGPTGGDCTAPYYVDIIDKPTVKQFVDDVLGNKNEWGRIEVRNAANVTLGGFWYRYGVLESDYAVSPALVNSIPNAIITRGMAAGGWSSMDYVIWVE